MSEEALQIAEKRREVKGKGERERYTQLNIKIQTIASRDKKAFLSEQCKAIEANNRMGKTRDLLWEKAMAPHSSTLAWKMPWTEEPGQAAVHRAAKSRTRLSDFPFTFHFHALEKEMATYSSVLAWKIPGMGEPGGLPSMGSQKSDTTEVT